MGHGGQIGKSLPHDLKSICNANNSSVNTNNSRELYSTISQLAEA